jgi:hypothetical protein
MPETGSYRGRSKCENEGNNQHRADVGRERLERSNKNFGKLGGKSRGNDDNKEKLEDGGKVSDRRSCGKTLKGSWSSDSMKDTREDSSKNAWGWYGSGDFEQERGSGRVGRKKTTARIIEVKTEWESMGREGNRGYGHSVEVCLWGNTLSQLIHIWK